MTAQVPDPLVQSPPNDTTGSIFSNAKPDADVMIDDLLRRAPAARPVLDRYGLRGCGGPFGPRESLDFLRVPTTSPSNGCWPSWRRPSVWTKAR